MGHAFEAKCRECGNEFEARQGGGLTFHLLHCDNCGRTKSIRFEELGEHHTRYLKGLTIPYSMATAELDNFTLKIPSGPAIAKEEYGAGVELIAGCCECGGKYGLSAPPRCPKCGSSDYSEGNLMVCYD
jgi:hypothetical protein